MDAFDILGDPVRRRILEVLARGEASSGELVTVIQREVDITQAAVSQHLKVLRQSGFASVRPERTRRIYAIEPKRLQEVDGGVRAVPEPREHPEIAAVPTVEHGGLLVVSQQRHRPRPGRHGPGAVRPGC